MFANYIKAAYRWSIYAGTITDAARVISDFLADAAARVPCSVRENEKYVFVSFKYDGYLYAYQVPIAYKKHVNGGNNNV